MCSDLFRYLAKQLLVSRMLIDVSHYLLIEHLKADKMNIREDFFKLLIITQQCYVVTSVLYLLDVHIFLPLHVSFVYESAKDSEKWLCHAYHVEHIACSWADRGPRPVVFTHTLLDELPISDLWQRD